MLTIIRKIGEKNYFYNNPKIIEKNKDYIIFIDTIKGKKITLPTQDYQIEEVGE